MTEVVRFLKQAVQVAHNCQAQHCDSVRVTEPKLWDGTVEVFKLTGHPNANTCYAWIYECDKIHHFITVLGSEEVDSPKAAVLAGVPLELGISKRTVLR